jgi:alpha-beta hydrolase superfamily lysophospholipase
VLKPSIRILFVIAFLLGIGGCGPDVYLIEHKPGQDTESEPFGYRAWKREHFDQDLVIIGIHGFCGASTDYANLGNHLVKRDSDVAVYAYELRGQGSDPIKERRGDIGHPSQWYTDLEAFTQLVRSRHPGAKIIWYGESMGALIATHALCSAPSDKPPCDGLILSSPIVRFKDDFEPWKVALVRVAAATAPLARIPIESLADDQNIQMTQYSSHGEQTKSNPYHIERHTLRLLGTLAKLIDGMNACAPKIEVPTLVLHGGKDYFNNDSDLRGFIARFPDETSVTYRNYPDSYHLLMYDKKKEKIFQDVAKWLNQRKSP